MTKTRNVKETFALFAIKGYFRSFVARLKKTFKLFLTSDKSHNVSELSPFDSLPEVCISLIISFTSPQDACVVALVSKTFDSAAKSNIAWEKFIPPEYSCLVPRSQYYTSKKELFFDLCDESILIDYDEKSFWIERASGKRCIMLSVMNLSILGGDFLHFWDWHPYHESRFEIRGRMNIRELSSRTRYSVYVVLKITDNYSGFGDVAIEAVVEVVGQEPSRRSICFDEFLSKDRGRTRIQDVWMEIELGEFFNEGGVINGDEIKMSALESPEQLHWKCGLIIQGIEIRPTKIR